MDEIDVDGNGVQQCPLRRARGLDAIDAWKKHATHLEVRKTSEITLSHAGEIDFEEFLLVIKNMQNPGTESA